MCGISAIISLGNCINYSIEEMAAAIKHRGPDDSGIYKDDLVQLGFNRLSIIDIEGGHQPFQIGNCNLIFNGEIYNYKEIKRELIGLGINFKSESDTEVILAGYLKWGIDLLLKKIHGMYAFVLYDKDRKKVYCVRDKIGIKPFFYSVINKQILISSEIKSFHKVSSEFKEANLESLSSYFSFRFPTPDKTFYKKISKLEPGHLIEICLDRFSLEYKKYWDINFNNQIKKIDEKDLIDKIDDCLTRIVEQHLNSEVKIGALLSGGVDSSLIVALMHKSINKNFETFSIGFDADSYNEHKYAQIVADKFQLKHHYYEMNHDNYDQLLTETISIKCAPLSIPHEVALNYLFKKIKGNNNIVVMSGEGADEVFGGYGRVMSSYFDYNKIEYIRKLPLRMQYYIQEKIDLTTYKNIGNKNYGFNQFFDDSYCWLKKSEKNLLFTDEYKSYINNLDIDNELNKYFGNYSYSNDNKIFNFFQKYHLQCLLDRLDIYSMNNGIEARVPFLDDRIISLINSIPTSIKIKWKNKLFSYFTNSNNYSERYDINKYLLRKIANKYLPSEISYRKKLGFPVPLDNWISNKKYKDSIYSILFDSKSINRGIFNVNYLKKLIDESPTKDYDFWGKQLWMVLNVELWFRTMVDNNA